MNTTQKEAGRFPTLQLVRGGVRGIWNTIRPAVDRTGGLGAEVLRVASRGRHLSNTAGTKPFQVPLFMHVIRDSRLPSMSQKIIPSIGTT